MYIDKRFSKKDKDDIFGIKNNNGDDNDEMDINENDSDNEDDDSKNNDSEYNNNDSNSNGSDNNDSNKNDSDYSEENSGEKGEEMMHEDVFNANNPNYLLSKVWGFKLNIIQRYFVKYLIDDIREKKKEDKDYYKK